MAEEKEIATGYIGNALRSSAADHTTTFADEIFDTERQKYQNEVNADLETTDNEIKADLEAETARAKGAEEAIIFDVSAHNDGAVFESLQALLSSSNLSTLIPQSVRHGGMIIRFIQGSKLSSDNKYVQFRLMSDEFTTDTIHWAIAEEGVYVENPEYVYVKTDKDDKILWAIKADGSIYYGAGVPLQIIDYINEKIAKLSLDEYEDIVAFLADLEKSDETLQDLLDKKVDGEYVENPEYVQVTTDNKNKILESVTSEGKKQINIPIDTPSATIEHINSPEWVKVVLDKEYKILFGIRVNGEIYPPSVDSEIQQDVEELKEDVGTLNQRIVNCEQEAASSLEAYSSVTTSIESLNEGVGRNAQEIDRIKGIESFSVAEGVEHRLESIESDVSNLKSQAGVGTDIVSLNGGETKIKDLLYGFKRLSFIDDARTIGLPPDWESDTGIHNNMLVLMHFSDIHDSGDAAARIKQFYDTFKMIGGIKTIDDVVFTGDLVGITYGYSKNKNEWSQWGIESVLFGIGNHDIILGTDYGTFENAAGWGKVPTTELYNHFIAPYVSQWNVIQPSNAAENGKLYYYKDYPSLGYRLFMLDCFDYKKPYRNDGGTLTEIPNTWDYKHEHVLSSLSDIGNITDAVVGTLFYVTVVANSTYDTYVVDSVSGNQITAYTPVVWQKDTQYRADQNTWFENALAGAKSLGYHVITTRHENQNVGTDVDCYWNTLSSGRSGNTDQGADLDRLSNEFVAGGGVIACELYGHRHTDKIQLRNNILAITISCSIRGQEYGQEIRVNNEKSMDAINLMALDKGKGLITLYRIGSDQDMNGRGRHMLIYDYINKNIKYQY